MRNNVVQLNNGFIAMFVALIALFVSPSLSAMTPSPALIAQLQSLPPAEQQRLMKQYGISSDSLGSGTTNNAQPLSTPNTVTERQNKNQLNIDLDNIDENSESKIKPYGYDIFEGEPSTFAQVSDIPIPAEYLMGPGDVVNVQIYGKENQKLSITVSRSGNIDLPNSGPMSVIGLTFDALKQELSNKINEQYTGVKSHISLGELRSIRVIIAGEAYKPGSYTVSSLSTITQALFVSGGVNEIASLRNIQLKRAGKTVTTFDLYDLLMKGDGSKDARLQSGDVIFIPPVVITATVKGEVRRPAIYELKGNETAHDLITLAAGLKANSFPKASVVERFSDDYLPILLNVDLTQHSGKRTLVKDGDVFIVQSTTEKIKDHILIAGSVSRPGFYQWRSGIRISDLITSQWSDLKGLVDLKYSLVTREVNSQGDIETIQFSLANIFENKNSEDNIYLEPRDSIIVFTQMNSEVVVNEDDDVKELDAEYLSRLYLDIDLIKRSAEFKRDELLSPIIKKLKTQDLVNNVTNVANIAGEVRFPGEYPISSNTKVKDLVIAAGGIKGSAYVKQAELTQFTIDEFNGAKVSHQNIKLDLALKNNINENIKINSRDQLTILKTPAWQENLTISVRGEVRFPGTYSIRDGETLDSVVARAGGYTKQAFLYGAIFTRESVKKQEQIQILKFTNQLRLDIATKGLSGDGTNVSFSEASLMLKELEDITPLGRMVLKLTKNSSSKHDNLLVEDKDKLYIPSQKQTITVVGEVQNASTHFYEKGVSFEQYISLSGGSKPRADEERVYIVQANGAVIFPEKGLWFSDTNNVKPGDTIVVPLNTEYKDNLTLWTQITSIVYNTAIALAAIGSL